MKTALMLLSIMIGSKTEVPRTVYVYVAGTNQIAYLYVPLGDGKGCTDIPLPNPFIGNQNGDVNFCAKKGSYRVVVK